MSLSASPKLPAVLAALLLAAAAAPGCGSGSGPEASSTVAGGARWFRTHPGQQATSAHISGADCSRLASALGRQLGAPASRASEPTPPSSRCRLSAPGAHVSVFLDAGYAARQRYSNRMTETVQFNAPDPAKIPHQVPGVGDPSPADQYASWIPAYSTLFAVRGNRWLTVAYAVSSEPRPRRLAGAVALARLGFRLTAR